MGTEKPSPPLMVVSAVQYQGHAFRVDRLTVLVLSHSGEVMRDLPEAMRQRGHTLLAGSPVDLERSTGAVQVAGATLDLIIELVNSPETRSPSTRFHLLDRTLPLEIMELGGSSSTTELVELAIRRFRSGQMEGSSQLH